VSTTEPYIIGRWIYRTLTNDSQFMSQVRSVQRGQAPISAPLPYAIYRLVAGQDMLAGFGATKTHVHCVYQLDIYAPGTSASPVELAVRRLYDLLSVVPAKGDLSVETTDGIIFDCIQVRALERFGVDGGVEWNSTLQQYEINARAA
jgi:hypothetical protein